MTKMLVIGEKPDQVMHYAKALGFNDKKDGYLEGDKYVYTWGYGHLLNLKSPDEYNPDWKVWSFEALPIIPERFSLKVIEGKKKQYNVIKKLINRTDIDSICIGTDCGREGEAIARYIIDSIGTKKKKYRLWIDSLEEKDIRQGFTNLKDASEYDNIYAGAKARSKADWIVGMNLSRAYTTKRAKGVLLSIGRVQTAVLNLIVSRDLEISNFKPEKYFEMKAEFEGYNGGLITKERIFDKEYLLKIKDEIEGKTGKVIEVKSEEKKQPHPQLFNLTNIQSVLNKKYGYSAKETLDIIQGLYEKKILTYPRTSSRHVTESIAQTFPEIIGAISFGKFEPYTNYCMSLEELPVSKRVVDNSKVSDHFALIPTKNEKIAQVYDSLNEKEKNVFDEVALSFLACFFEPYKYESTTVITQVEGHEFKTMGKKELEQGWKKVYSNGEEEKEEKIRLEKIDEGMEVNLNEVNIEDKTTKPKPSYTESSLLLTMENPRAFIEDDELKKIISTCGIGCESTRSNIIELLIRREYISRNKKKIQSTMTGQELIKAIEGEQLKSIALTAKWEEDLERIERGEYTEEEFVNEIINFTKEEIDRIKNSDKGTIIEENIFENIELGTCPKCQEGIIIENKSGYGCTKWKGGCNFFISKKIAGKNITIKQAKTLLKTGKTSKIKGFKSSKGNVFDGYLELEGGEVKIKYANTNEDVLGKCPECGKGNVRENQKAFGCDRWKEGCKFSIFKENKFIDKKITKTFVKKLIQDKEKEYVLVKNQKGYWNIYKR